MINNPTEILPASGCVIWLDGSNSTYFKQLSTGLTDVNNNDPVGYWQNLGSLSSTPNPVVAGHFTNLGGTNATRPTYIAAVSGIRFLDAHYLTLSASQLYTQSTIFIVTAPSTSFTANDRIYSHAASGLADNNVYLPLVQTSTGGAVGSWETAGTTVRSSTSHRALSTFDIFTSRHSGSDILNFRNGEPSTAFTHSLGTTFTPIRHRIGAEITSAGAAQNFYSGFVSEVIVYNRALTPLEREDVEYYLTRKWSVLSTIPRQVYALKNGNWSDNTLWSVSADPSPFNIVLSSDNVYTNNFTVIANQNILVNSLRTTALTPNISAGGTFVVDQPYNIASLSGLFTGITTGLSCVHTTGTVFLTSTNIVGGSLANSHGIINERAGNLNVIGNITGGTNATAYGIINNSTGTVNVLSGAVFASTGGAGVVNNSTGTFILNSPASVVGGSGTFSYGALNNSTGNMLLSANITGGSVAAAYGIVNNSTGNLFLTGNVTGGSQATAYGAFNNTTGNLTIRGNVLAATGPGCWNNAAGNLTVIGNVSGAATTGVVNNGLGNVYITAPNIVQGGTAASAHGLNNSSAGNCYVTGNVLGGTNATARGIINTSVGAVIVNGNVTARAGSTAGEGIVQSSTGTLLVNGNIAATPAQNAIVAANAGAINEFTGALLNSDNGRQAVFATRYLLRPKVFESYTYHKNTEIVNLLFRSEELNNTSSWVVAGTTVTANVTAAPYSGALSAERIQEDTSTGGHTLRASTVSTIISSVPGVANDLVFSVFARTNNQRRHMALIVDTGAASGSTAPAGLSAFGAMFDLVTGQCTALTATGTNSVVLTSITNEGGGWWRCMVEGRLNMPSTPWPTFPTIALSDRSSFTTGTFSGIIPTYTGVGTVSGIGVWGAQYQYNSLSQYFSSDGTFQGFGNLVPPVFFYSPEAYNMAYVPNTSSVRIGTLYGAVSTLSGIPVGIPEQLEGTMFVPSSSVVSLGTLVDNTTGVAILNSQSLQNAWNTNINTINLANSIGVRLKNVAALPDIGEQIGSVNI